jgi:hypothetical protein
MSEKIARTSNPLEGIAESMVAFGGAALERRRAFGCRFCGNNESNRRRFGAEGRDALRDAGAARRCRR